MIVTHPGGSRYGPVIIGVCLIGTILVPVRRIGTDTFLDCNMASEIVSFARIFHCVLAIVSVRDSVFVMCVFERDTLLEQVPDGSDADCDVVNEDDGNVVNVPLSIVVVEEIVTECESVSPLLGRRRVFDVDWLLE